MVRLLLLVLLPSVVAACGGAEAPPARAASAGTPDSIAGAAVAAQPAATSTNGADGAATGAAGTADAPRRGPPVVLFIGTSLTAGLGLDPSQAYPQRVEELAAAEGVPIRAVNAGLSGETSAGALRRVDWVLGRTRADVVVLETGANDGLRAFAPSTIRANVDSLVARVRARQPHARVMLVQMEAPPNLGERYTRDFHAIFPSVANQYGIPLVPFLREGVAGKPELNQADGLHPTPQGARIAARTVWTALEPVVRELATAR